MLSYIVCRKVASERVLLDVFWGDGCLMLGVDEVLLWVLGIDVLGVRCLMLGVDEVLSWVVGVDVLGVRC